MSIEQLKIIEQIMDSVKCRSLAPTPQVGEGLVDYWLRTVRREAWEEGVGVGMDFERGAIDSLENPYDSLPAPAQQD
jgi:hypothetical protein